MTEEKWGLDGDYIPRREVPFEFNDLDDLDMIQGSNGQILQYIKDERSYLLVSDNPVSEFAVLLQNWKKI